MLREDQVIFLIKKLALILKIEGLLLGGWKFVVTLCMHGIWFRSILYLRCLSILSL
jgi:hypothetical protein